jgi:hypothetical protein
MTPGTSGEPENPAPVLDLAASQDTGTPTTAIPQITTPAAAAASADTASTTSVRIALILSIAGVVIGPTGLAFGVTARRATGGRPRSPSPDATAP